MCDSSRWKPGSPIVLRGVWRQRLWFACPVVVVQDDPALIAVYWRTGTWVKVPEKRFAPQAMLATEQLDLVDKMWTETDVLMLAVPGASHSVYAMWEAGHTSFKCWYINLEEPLRRTSRGFDTMDHLLDVVASPDRSEWRWKDEDEFMEAEAIGVYSSVEARAIRAEGERVIKLMQANQPPFCDGWEKWTPPPEWSIPGLPADWDNIGAGDGSP